MCARGSNRAPASGPSTSPLDGSKRMADLRCGVWITTLDHLRGFREVYDRTSTVDRFRGTYALPAGFPRTKIARFGKSPLEVPMAILSAGELTLDAENLVYSHDPKPRYADLRDLSFSTPVRGLEITLVHPDYAPMRQFNLPYISFQVRSIEAGALLMTASGLGPFTFLIRRRTKSLFDKMVSAGAVPLPSNNRWSGP